MDKISVISIIKAYKTARASGLSFADICNLINWPYAHQLAERLGNPIIKIAVRFAEFACSLAPEKQNELLAILDQEVDTV